MSRPTNYTDTELIEGLAAGENAAIAEIYRLYQPILLKWMVSRGGEEIDAYDVFQEGILVLFEKAADPSFALTCKLSTYLFAVCKRIWFKKTQQRSNTSSLDIGKRTDEDNDEDLASYDEDIDVHREKESNFDKLEHSLDQLGSPCKELLRAFYIDDKSMQEIAAAFNYTNAENAKTQKYKCLNRLKKIFFSAKMVINN